MRRKGPGLPAVGLTKQFLSSAARVRTSRSLVNITRSLSLSPPLSLRSSFVLYRVANSLECAFFGYPMGFLRCTQYSWFKEVLTFEFVRGVDI